MQNTLKNLKLFLCLLITNQPRPSVTDHGHRGVSIWSL
jgi:hypothetical protein